MAGFSSYPNGIGAAGLTIREIPIHAAYPGQIFWVYNGTALGGARVNGSDQNKGTFNRPFATVAYAISQCTANRGDVIMVKAGHAETISDATTFAANIAGVAVIGLGAGTLRPTFTFSTANTATIPVSAANVAFVNCRFVANFLSIAAPFTLSTAKGFTVQSCDFSETSSVLNFLNIVKSTGAANTIDGMT
jgi:calcineurin-like phosphoesterase